MGWTVQSPLMQIKRRAEAVLRGKEQEVLGKREGLKGVEKTHAAAEYVSGATGSSAEVNG